MSSDQSHLPSETALRARALESLLVEKGLVKPETLDAIIETYQDKVGPRNGAHLVALAWTDADFRRRLLADASEAAAGMGYYGRQDEYLKAVENTPEVHNLVVCTLCSCYPWTVLGLPPVWYKSVPYRSRAVSDPHSILAEFGTELPEQVRIRVWDSTSEMRYLVVPMRPAGTEGWSVEQLRPLATRNAMIGVEQALPPERAAP